MVNKPFIKWKTPSPSLSKNGVNQNTSIKSLAGMSYPQKKRGSRTYFYINGYEVYNTYLSYNSYPKQVGIFLGNGSSVLSGLTVEDFRLEYSGGNSNNGDGEQDRAPGKY